MARRKASKPTKAAKSTNESDSEFGIYNVERIIAKKTDKNGKVFYLIKWEGYPSSQNTWETEENVFSEVLIKDFEDREKSKTSNAIDEFTPSKSPIRTPVSPRRSPLKNQKPQVVSAKTVNRDPETGELSVHCIMSDNSIEIIPASIANVMYPQIVIAFYESRPCFIFMKIAVQGCCHGELHKIYESLANIEKKENTKVDLLLICGDFQAIRNETDLNCMACPVKYQRMGDFKDYFDGSCIAPVLTVFIGGNHEATNHLQELYYGGWVCHNIYYLGHSGVINFGGLRIAGISGIYYPRDYRIGYYEKAPFSYEMVRSAYHYREFEVKKLLKIKGNIDIFLSHEWPTEIYNYGNTNELLRKKPYFKNEIQSNQLGAKPLQELMDNLKPKNWYSAHLHVGFDALKTFPDGSSTKFVALDKCISNRDFLRIIEVTPKYQKSGIPQLEYDSEWLAILKESEQYLNFSRTTWIIPKEFFKSLRKEAENIISDENNKIPIPKGTNEFGLTQTRIFKLRFLNFPPQESEARINPEEISLDI